MPDPKKPEAPAPSIFHRVGVALGIAAETPEELAARKKREADDARTREAIQSAIRGVGIVKQVVNDSKKKQ